MSRHDQDAFATFSHSKAARAREKGRFADEIVPVETGYGLVSEDGCIRPGTNVEGLAGLKPSFIEGGSVTPGTSSPLTDGASATLICTTEFADRYGLEPLAKDSQRRCCFMQSGADGHRPDSCHA